MDPLFLLWGKTAQNRDGQPVPPADANLFHPLIFHMIDTAEMARAIWRHSLGSALRARWAEACGGEPYEREGR
ncbi:MAG: hypothetical protein IMW99_07605 [Firmicutes bacterium]|nr:hypothetical protein [Bacillota bacterium]